MNFKQKIQYLVSFEVCIKFRIVVEKSFGEMLKLLCHRDPVGEEVLLQSLHQRAEAEVRVGLVVHRDQ